MHVIHRITAALVAAGVCSTAYAVNNLDIIPGSTTVNPSALFSMTVRGSSFADIVVGGGFSLTFNPSVLSLISVTITNPPWEFVPNPGTPGAPGTWNNVSFNTFQNSPTGQFDTATLNFRAEAPGISAVTLTASPLFPFANLAGQPIPVTYGSATVTVVPEPATVASMLLGLGLLTLLLRRDRA